MIQPLPPPLPVELGCGTLVPARWSHLCVVYNYDHNALCAPNAVDDKPFEMNVLVQTTRGLWRFHGQNGVEEIDSTLLVAGVQGDRYGCGHDRRHIDSNLIASLRPSALDEDDQPLFGKQVLPGKAVPKLQRAMTAQTDDSFDSRIFEIFDIASAQSLRESRARAKNRLRMQRVKRFIEAHAFEDISLQEIAACVNLSPFACLRQFKMSTGMTPHAYVSKLRLARARELLLNAAIPVSTVGTTVGVRDHCYFSRWFVKETGMSPVRFRRTFG